MLSSQTFAAPQVFFGENQSPGGVVSGAPATAKNNFLALVGGAGTENFDSFANGTATPISITFPGSTGNITATLSGSGNITTSNSAGRFATSGSGYFNTNSNFQISFSSPVAAFGFFATDVGDISGQMSLVLANGGGTVPLTIPHTINGNNGSLLYYGFVDTANTYTAINFVTTNNSDIFGFDDMTVADANQIIVPSTIPTLSEWSLIMLAILLTLISWLGIGRKAPMLK